MLILFAVLVAVIVVAELTRPKAAAVALIPMTELAALHPEFGRRLLEFLIRALQAGLMPKFTSGFRTAREQNALKAAGRARLSAEETLHTKGLAADFVEAQGRYPALASIAREVGLQAVIEADHLHLELD